jgi:ATP-dependent Clp protease adaptor protein ClpS
VIEETMTTAQVAREEPRIAEAPQQAAARPRTLPPYAVVVLNDNDHTFDYVIEAFQKVFGYSKERAYQLTLQIHHRGRGIVWSGPKEVAELKVEQLRSVGPDFYASREVRYPLRAYIEPLPG